jgi:hypothetical protein
LHLYGSGQRPIFASIGKSTRRNHSIYRI